MVKRMMGRADNRRIWAGMIAVMMLVSGIFLSRGVAEGTDEPMVRALSAVGAEADMVTIDLWGRFDHLAGDKKRQNELADRIVMLDERETDAYTEERSGQSITRRCVGDDTSYMTVAAAENLRPKDAPEVCLAVRLSAEGGRFAELTEQAEKIEAIGENFGGKIARNTCLRGLISGKLKSTEKTQHLEKILAQLGAQMITIQESDQYISCTAYAPQRKGAVQVSGETVNLHIVLRDSERGTEIYLGSPILMMEY